MLGMISELAGICAMAALAERLLDGTRWRGTLRFMIGLRMVRMLAGLAEAFVHIFK